MAGRRAKGQAADGTLTVQWEWFPAEPSKEPQADPWRRGEETWLEMEARLFGAAMRTAFHRLAEGLTRASRRKAPAPPAGGEIAPGQGVAVETTADRAVTLRGELRRHPQGPHFSNQDSPVRPAATRQASLSRRPVAQAAGYDLP